MKTLPRKGFVAGVSTLLLLTACGSSNQSNSFQADPGPVSEELNICSTLDFSGTTWPTGFTDFQEEAFELALNISGSYEGESVWANLTNNFDGQGLSMGLLNQNLGQGSLQPLLIQMMNNYMADLQQIFTAADLESLISMLSQWQSASSPDVDAQNVQKRLSVKDESVTASGTLAPSADLAAPQAASVQWAVTNLYSDGGTTFVPRWASELSALGNNPDYVSVQIQAALSLHNQSVADLNPLQVPEIRAYLMVFDIEVQDGGIYAQDFTDYATWLGQNPSSNGTTRLVEMLNLRLRHVLSQYVADVQSRKMAIINGSGVVHGENRNLETQYCFNRFTLFPTQ